jgi:hypothetical protein
MDVETEQHNLPMINVNSKKRSIDETFPLFQIGCPVGVRSLLQPGVQQRPVYLCCAFAGTPC